MHKQSTLSFVFWFALRAYGNFFYAYRGKVGGSSEFFHKGLALSDNCGNSLLYITQRT